MKKLLLTFMLASLYAFDAYAQSSKWMILSGFSPVSRSADNRILENPSDEKAWEWMNRGGWMLNDGISVGVTGTVRYQTNKQMTTYEGDLITSTYERKIIDNLFGVGPFVTKFFTLSSRFSLQTTLFGLAEFGKGTFKIIEVESHCNYNCVSFADPNAFLPREVDRRAYKEQFLCRIGSRDKLFC